MKKTGKRIISTIVVCLTLTVLLVTNVLAGSVSVKLQTRGSNIVYSSDYTANGSYVMYTISNHLTSDGSPYIRIQMDPMTTNHNVDMHLVLWKRNSNGTLSLNRDLPMYSGNLGYYGSTQVELKFYIDITPSYTYSGLTSGQKYTLSFQAKGAKTACYFIVEGNLSNIK